MVTTPYIISAVFTIIGYGFVGLAFSFDDPARFILTLTAVFIVQLSSSFRGWVAAEASSR